MNEEKISCVIIDDELHARKLLKKYIDQSGVLEVIGEFANAATALKGIAELAPEVLFLDVQMPGKTGIEMLELLENCEQYIVVFTTAYDQYAIKAFDSSAIDYLLKPFDEVRFGLAMEKLKKARRTAANDKNYELDKISKLLTQFQHQGIPDKICLEKITCKFAGKLRIVQLKDVYYIEADGNYSQAHTGDGAFLLDVSITDISARLNPTVFVRIHRSTIVNTSFITAIEPILMENIKLSLRTK